MEEVLLKILLMNFFLGIDVITSGNHIWDKEETSTFIEKERRLLRPANLAEGSPGKGFGNIFFKNKNFKVGVINLWEMFL